jgi:hypothetical protein
MDLVPVWAIVRMGTMKNNGNTLDKISLYPDQLTSVLSLARVLPASRYAVLLALIHYLQEDSLKSTATRDEIKKFTGLGERTIYTCIREFVEYGLIKEWRGPFELKQKFYRINLPAPDSVFEFYGSRKESVSRPRQQSTPNDSKPSNSIIQVDLPAAPAANSTALTDCSDAAPTQEVDMTQVTTDSNNLSLTAETEPALDPRIIQILDLKATEDGNVIVKFLKRHGLSHTNNFGTVRIDREGLLRFLLESGANTLEGFSRLVREFQASPQFDLPPDEDLQIDLHNSFFHYPYGAQWFWEHCRTRDDNGFRLREGGFGANLLTFMAAHGLKSVGDIVQKVAEMNEKLRPRPPAPETSSLETIGIAS